MKNNSQTPPEPGKNVPKGSILVIDDDKGFRKVLSDILTKSGHTVFRAGDTKDALSRLRKSKVNVVIADYNLPSGNGLDFLKRIPELGLSYNPKGVLISGFASLAEAEEADDLGIPFLSKPLNNAKLIRLVESSVKLQDLEERIEETAKKLAHRRLTDSGSSVTAPDEMKQHYMDAESYHTKRVLLIHKDKEQREAIGHKLVVDGNFRVIPTEEGAAAFDVITREPIDLVLCDVELPYHAESEKGSIVLLNFIRERFKEKTPIGVLFTNNPELSSAECAREAMSQGAFDYLTRIDDIAQAVRQIFGRKLEQDADKFIPRLESRLEKFEDVRELEILDYIYRARKLKGQIWISEETDEYAEGPVILRPIDRGQVYDRKSFGPLERFNIDIARQKQKDYEHFKDDPDFKVAETLPLTIDHLREVGYIRREFVVGPSLAEVFLKINNEISQLEEKGKSAEGEEKNKLKLRLKRINELKGALLGKTLRDLVYWQEAIGSDIEYSEELYEKGKDEYIRHLEAVPSEFAKFTEIKFSDTELDVYRYCLSAFKDRIRFDENSFTRKLDFASWNIALRTKKINSSLDEILELSEDENKRLDLKKLDDMFVHFDIGSNYSIGYSGVLQDFYHMMDSFEAGLSAEEIEKYFCIFLLEKAKYHYEQRKGYWFDGEDRWMKEIEHLISEIGEGRADMHDKRTIERIQSYGLERFDKNAAEEKVHRTLRKSHLFLTLYERKNHQRFKEGYREEAKFRERSQLHKICIMHHNRIALAYEKRLEEDEDQFKRAYEETGTWDRLKDEYFALEKLNSKIDSNLNKRSAREFDRYLKGLQQKIDSSSEEVKPFYEKLLDIGKLRYCLAVWQKLANFNESTEINFETKNG
jgi:CheY-like chemotaxis protein